MLLEQRIKNLKDITQSEKAISDFILNNKDKIKNLSTRDIAIRTFTSSSTIVRFAKRLNYSGWNELKEDYLSELNYISTHFQNIDANIPFDKNDSFMNIAGKISTLMKETADDTLSLINYDNLRKAVNLLLNSESIHILAISSPLLYGEIFKYKMTRLGKHVDLVKLTGEIGFNINLVKNTHCALLISYSGESPLVIRMATLLKQRNTPIIAITSLGDNSLRNLADVTISISTREKLYSKISSYSSEYSIHYILDLLYSCYFAANYDENLKSKINFSKEIELLRFSTSDVIKEK